MHWNFAIAKLIHEARDNVGSTVCISWASLLLCSALRLGMVSSYFADQRGFKTTGKYRLKVGLKPLTISGIVVLATDAA